MNSGDSSARAIPAGAPGAWLARHPLLVIGLLLLACLGPFVDKAVYTDDALFVWAGQWVQNHPADFYGSAVNWWVSAVPMWVANWNPPLLSYVFAGAGAVFGWHEVVLHLVCGLFSFTACAGIYALAKMWCARPLLATSIAIFTPAFLVSSSTLMCDVPMLALWIWAVVLWERAVTGEYSRWLFVGAGFLAALAVLTKYSALTLLPMLPLLSLMRSRRPGWWLAGLAVPVILVGGYEFLTREMYGQDLLAAASHHARAFRPGYGGGWLAVGILGLSFAGGSLLPALFFAPALWRPRVLVVAACVTTGVWLALFQNWNSLGLFDQPARLKHWAFVLEVAVLVAGGAHILALAAIEAWQRRNAVSFALLFWISGVMFFAVVVNWLINARSFLPLVPPVAILLVRRLEAAGGSGAGVIGWLAPLCAAAIVAISLVFSDCETANAERSAAQQIAAQYQPAGHQLWFVGHGTFQYYLQNLGGLPIDATSTLLQPGDVVAVPAAVPMASYGIATLPQGSVGWLDQVFRYPSAWINLAGETPGAAAGFYGANWGPVPFAVGGIPGQTYIIVRVFSSVQMSSKPVNLHGLKIDDVPNIPQILLAVKDPIAFPLRPAAAAEMQLAGQSEAGGNIAEAIGHCRQALAVDDRNPAVLNHLAWLLATAGDHQLRSGDEAVRLATRAVQITDSRIPAIMETLGAAYAETGQFPQAMETTKAAAELAQFTNQQKVERESMALLHLYAARRTFAGSRQ